MRTARDNRTTTSSDLTIPGVTVIQLDDLDTGKIERLAEHSFVVICTLPGNHQAWLAMNDASAEKEAAKDSVRRLKKATDADATASGATWGFRRR